MENSARDQIMTSRIQAVIRHLYRISSPEHGEITDQDVETILILCQNNKTLASQIIDTVTKIVGENKL